MPIYQHKYESDLWFKLIFAILILLFIGLAIISSSEPFQLSSFITHPQDFPKPLGEWAIECEPTSKRIFPTKIYLLLDTLFPLALGFVLVLLVKGTTKATNVNATNDRLFEFKLGRLNLAAQVTLGLVTLAILFDWRENYLVYDALINSVQGNGRNFDSHTYDFIFKAKMLFYLLPASLLIGSYLYVYWLDFGKYWKRYIGPLYPSILGVFFSLLVFAFFTQAFDFIVELIDPFNLIAFLILFVFALVGLWMTPYYLVYTDKSFFRNLSLQQILKYTIVPLTEPTTKRRSRTLKEIYSTFYPSEESLFHAMRRGIALAFIVIFLILQLNLLRDIAGINAAIPGIITACNIIGLIVIYRLFLKAKRSDLADIKNHQDNSRRLTAKRLNKESKLFALGTRLFWIILINVLLATAHVSICFATHSEQPTFLVEKLILSTAHGFLFSWSFFIYVLFRKVKLQKEDFRFAFSRNVYSLIRKVSFTPRLMTWFFIVSGLAILFICILLGAHSPFLERINPLNLFIIVLNFFIALVALLGRIVKASLASKRFRFGPRSAGVILTSMVILIITFRLHEDHYHDLHRKTITNGRDLPYLSLASYTEKFLQDHSTDSIVYLVAADGGGLKAAYWTMKVLQSIQDKNPSFFNNVFITSGASGGMVGLGMYTYMHGQKMTPQERHQIIDTLGATNFLNNDLAGLTIKSPLVQLLPFLAPYIKDRTAAMSHRYFQLASRTAADFDSIMNKPFAYLWHRHNYKDLPLLIVNTTKTEDGSRGVVHPLDIKPEDELLGSFTDLTDIYYQEEAIDSVVSLNLPDGLFTTNRFPVVSPFARIEGKGHFVDGGYLENSGLSTIYHFLNYMQLERDSTSIYGDLLKKRLVVISIGNDQSSHIRNQISNPTINRSGSTGSILAIVGAVAGGGLSALPQYYDHLFDRLIEPKNGSAIRTRFVKIDLPFPYTITDINQVFNGQVTDCTLDQYVEKNRRTILNSINSERSHCSYCQEDKYLLTPALGRFMSRPAQYYMQDMLKHPEVEMAIDDVME